MTKLLRAAAGLVLVASSASAQTAIERRINGAPSGNVTFHFASRADVCGDGRTYIRADDMWMGSFNDGVRSMECERTSGMSLGQSLNLVNGPTVGEAIRDPRNSIADFLAVEKNAKDVVEELFISFLCRKPTDAEEKEMVAALDPGDIENLAALSSEAGEQIAAQQVEWEKAQNIATWSVLCLTIVPLSSRQSVVQGTADPVPGQPGKDVVWVPTPTDLVEKMLDLAGVTPEDFVMDLGSGDGRTIIAAARRGARE